MTADPSQVAAGQRDARILSLILKGKLTESSSVDDGAGGPAIPLASHPRYSHVLQLTRTALSTRLLEQSEWWANREPEWTATLGEGGIWTLLSRISREHLTGVLAIEHGDVSKAIAFSSGLALCATSSRIDEGLGSLLISREHVEPLQINELEELCKSKSQSLEWGLLHLGFMEPKSVLEILQEQARKRLLDLFTWREGQATFFADKRAAQVNQVINMPILRMFRRGFFGTAGASHTEMLQIFGPLTQLDTPLSITRPLGTLEFTSEGHEQTAIAAAKAGHSPVEFLDKLEAGGDRDVADGLAALYVFMQMGFIGFDGEQPILPLPSWLRGTGSPEASEDAPAQSIQAMGLSSIDSSHADIPADSAIASLLASSPHVKAPDEPAEGSEQAATEAASDEPEEVLAGYQEQRTLDEQGRRHLNSRQFDEAVQNLQKLADLQRRPTDTLAYLSVALILRNHPGDRDKAKSVAASLLEANPESPLGHAAMSRVHRAHRERNPSRRERARAYALSRGVDGLEREVRGLIEVGQDLEKITQTTFHTRRSPLADLPSVDAFGWMIVVGVFGILFATSNAMQLGENEYFYDPKDKYFFVRRIILLIGGIAGTFYITRGSVRDVIDSFGWKIHGPYIFFGLIIGGAVGFLSPAQRVTSAFEIVAALTVLHVLAEEIFFRGYVTNLLLGMVPDQAPAAMVASGAIFGIYHLTYYSFWWETDVIPKFYYVAAISLLAGVPYAWLYVKTKSLVTPFVCHLAVNMTMMYFSTIGAS